MIKAEIISHEGNPGPNWLDRCRVLITPTSISTLIVLVAIAGISLAVIGKQSSNSVERAANSNNSTPAVNAAPLTVAPSTAQTYQSTNGNSSVQGAIGSSESNATGQAANNAPGTETPLNATATTPDVMQSSFNQQSSFRGSSLSNKVQ